MRTLLAIIVAFYLATVCAAAHFDPFQGPKPLAIFIQSDPWAMVIGSDTPRVAIYENGETIFAKKVNDRLAIFLDGALLPKLREFLATRKPKSAVGIEGKKMAVSYRFTFPGEPAWRKAFAAAGEQAEKQEQQAQKRGG